MSDLLTTTSATYAAINAAEVVYYNITKAARDQAQLVQTQNLAWDVTQPQPPATVPDGFVKTSQNAYRPAQWNDPQLVYAKTNVGGYFFDAIIRAEHNSQNRITQHPVQTGAAISDHAYRLPDHLVLEIGMSDAMDSYVSGQFTGAASKSVSAYQTLRDLKDTFQLLTITTRLYTYNNMLIEQITSQDDHKTRDGLRCTVVFQELFMANVGTVVVAARPVTQTRSATTAAPLQPQPTLLRQMEDAATGRH